MWKESTYQARLDESSCRIEEAFLLETKNLKIFTLNILTGKSPDFEMIPNWYLRCREIGVERVDLNTSSRSIAQERAIAYLRKRIKELALDLTDPISDY